MQGFCTQEPPSALEPPRSTGTQCVLSIFEDFIELAQPSLWLSDVYLNIVGGVEKDHATLVGIHFADARLWLTDCVMRGDGVRARAIDVRELRRLYARGALPTQHRCSFLLRPPSLCGYRARGYGRGMVSAVEHKAMAV